MGDGALALQPLGALEHRVRGLTPFDRGGGEQRIPEIDDCGKVGIEGVPNLHAVRTSAAHEEKNALGEQAPQHGRLGTEASASCALPSPS